MLFVLKRSLAEQIAELTEEFKQYDENHDGFITADEFRSAGKKAGLDDDAIEKAVEEVMVPDFFFINLLKYLISTL